MVTKKIKQLYNKYNSSKSLEDWETLYSEFMVHVNRLKWFQRSMWEESLTTFKNTGDPRFAKSAAAHRYASEMIQVFQDQLEQWMLDGNDLDQFLQEIQGEVLERVVAANDEYKVKGLVIVGQIISQAIVSISLNK